MIVVTVSFLKAVAEKLRRYRECDPGDAHDDELQRFSKSGVPVLAEMRMV